MKPTEIIEFITNKYSGIKPKASWGETSLFYNPHHILANGVYFCTIKEKDGENDKASNLYREGIFRLSLGIGKKHYQSKFGEPPERPQKGKTVNTGHDFKATDQLMPHPIYAWMGWVCINNPSQKSFQNLTDDIDLSYKIAVSKFEKNKTVKDFYTQLANEE